MIVMKFGGTSVEDASAIRTVCHIIASRLHLRPLVVVSACAGVTSSLIEIAGNASKGLETEALEQLSLLRVRHKKIALELQLNDETVLPLLDRDFDEIRRAVQGIFALRELTPKTLDYITAFGELWSSTLLGAGLSQSQIPVQVVDARTILVTNSNFTFAEPILDDTREKALGVFSPLIDNGTVVVTQGFIGATKDGITTTIGRGGSDYSASIFGSVLNADEIQIWTDVDGILTADPSILPEARLIKEMTFNEASELAYFGARVLHPSTILPAIKKNIPVRVLNTWRPSTEGTLISRVSLTDRGCLLKSIAYKEGITVITIQSTGMLMNHGFLARVFDAFARHKKGVDVVATSEVGISLTIDNDSAIESIIGELEEIAEVRVEKHKAVMCVVGENLKYTKGIAARIFTALSKAGVNIELISHGGSEINLTFVIDETDIQNAVKSLHDELFRNALKESITVEESQETVGSVDSRLRFA
ncbi:MAG: lysine-sensitive aspartokinase 3 [Ignavibacteriales bacterium]|nr:lysine-sensitive aspartokinase 3 [Ignavibacteriales bacterium]